MAADEAGDIVAYLVLPSTIYGISSRVLGDGSLANPLCTFCFFTQLLQLHAKKTRIAAIQMPTLIRAGIKRKQAAVFGAGKNVCEYYFAISPSTITEVVAQGHMYISTI